MDAIRLTRYRVEKKFGYGARAEVGADSLTLHQAKQWLARQLEDPQASQLAGAALARSDDLICELKRENRAFKQAFDKTADNPPKNRRPGQFQGRIDRLEIEARTHRAMESETPFVERLVDFWSNHFCIAQSKSGMVRILAGAYEREAIRPHVLGKFRDMLQAVIHHPAMLLYLDNADSIGPNSEVGLKKQKGLNENLGRELLELHTLGVDGGYSQQDVTNLSRILTGWTVQQRLTDDSCSSGFMFRSKTHEPGEVPLLGELFDQTGIEQGEAVLDRLAQHPSTAKFIANKFAAYFTGGSPPPAFVEQLRQTFIDTDGDMLALSRVVIDADEVWLAPIRQIIPPYDLLVAAGRALNLRPSGKEIRTFLSRLGQPVWNPPSPKGWPVGASIWGAPDAYLERLDWAQKAIAKLASGMDVPRLAETLMGEDLSESTGAALRQANSPKQALALLLMSPEFQLR